MEEDQILVDIGTLDQAARVALAEEAARSAGVKRHFRDALPSGGPGPELAVVPAGRFELGAPVSEFGSTDSERPCKRVTIARAYAVGRYPVTRDEFETFQTATGWSPDRELLWPKTARTPVFNVRPADIRAYLAWLSEQTGAHYRLPTESEWEFAARAGTSTAFAFGDSVSCRDVHFNSLFPYAERRERRKWYLPLCIPVGKPLEVGMFPANVWGLHDMHGNVQEFTSTPWHDDHRGCPTDGEYREDPTNDWVVAKGGSWFDPAVAARSAARRRRHVDEMDTNLGFRVLREL